MKTVIHTILVVLGLPSPVMALIARMNAILEAMLANKTVFPSPPVAIALAQSHVVALNDAETATKTKTPGSIAIRDAAQLLVIQDAKQLHGYVQQLANASPDQAATLAANAAMKLRKTAVRPVHDLTVKQTASGTILVHAGNVAGAKAHEWQYSLDGGKSWVSAPPSTKATTTITGFTTGAVVQVRHRSIVKGGPGDWSSVSTIAVS